MCLNQNFKKEIELKDYRKYQRASHVVKGSTVSVTFWFHLWVCAWENWGVLSNVFLTLRHSQDQKSLKASSEGYGQYSPLWLDVSRDSFFSCYMDFYATDSSSIFFLGKFRHFLVSAESSGYGIIKIKAQRVWNRTENPTLTSLCISFFPPVPPRPSLESLCAICMTFCCLCCRNRRSLGSDVGSGTPQSTQREQSLL